MSRWWHPPLLTIIPGNDQTSLSVANASAPAATQASCVAIDPTTRRIQAIGDDAQELAQKGVSELSFQTPWHNGVITDQSAARVILSSLLRKQLGWLSWQPVATVSLPTTTTTTDHLAWSKLGKQLGWRETVLVKQPVAAAIGSGLPLIDEKLNGIITIDTASSSVAVVGMGSVIKSSGRLPGFTDHLNQLNAWLAEKHQFQLPPISTKQHWCELLDEWQTSSSSNLQLSGTKDGRVTSISVARSDWLTKLNQWSIEVAAAVEEIMNQLTPTAVWDVTQRGWLLTGSWANTPGLATQLAQQLKLPLAVVEQPDQVEQLGLERIVTNLKLFKQSISYNPPPQ